MARASKKAKRLALGRFAFQVNISVKIRAGLLRSLCGYLNERFVSDQLSSLEKMFRGWAICLPRKSRIITAATRRANCCFRNQELTTSIVVFLRLLLFNGTILQRKYVKQIL